MCVCTSSSSLPFSLLSLGEQRKWPSRINSSTQTFGDGMIIR